MHKYKFSNSWLAIEAWQASRISKEVVVVVMQLVYPQENGGGWVGVGLLASFPFKMVSSDEK